MSAKTCPSVLKFTVKGVRRTTSRYIQCNKPVGHEWVHFASWGGSQSWRQAKWYDGDEGIMDIADVPKGKRVW